MGLFSRKKKNNADIILEALAANEEMYNTPYDDSEFINDPDYGLTANKPIMTRRVSGSNIYLSRLETSDGEEITWDRTLSLSVEGINGMIDRYEISVGGVQRATIYIDMYGAGISSHAPMGFRFKGSNNAQTTGVNYKKDVEPKPNNVDYNYYNEDEEYGLVYNKPIMVKDEVGCKQYLMSLCTADGKSITYEHIRTVDVKGITGKVSFYDIFVDGRKKTTIYLNLYGTKVSKECPRGFSFLKGTLDEQRDSKQTNPRSADKDIETEIIREVPSANCKNETEERKEVAPKPAKSEQKFSYEEVKSLFDRNGLSFDNEEIGLYTNMFNILSHFTNHKLNLDELFNTYDVLGNLITNSDPNRAEIKSEERIRAQMKRMESLGSAAGLLTEEEKMRFAFCVYHTLCVNVYDEKKNEVLLGLCDFTDIAHVEALYQEDKKRNEDRYRR